MSDSPESFHNYSKSNSANVQSSVRLTNNDFRRLLLTPREPASHSLKHNVTKTSSNVRSLNSQQLAKTQIKIQSIDNSEKQIRLDKKKKKKAFYALKAKMKTIESKKLSNNQIITKKDLSNAANSLEFDDLDPSAIIEDTAMQSSQIQYRDRAKERRERKILPLTESEGLHQNADYRSVAPSGRVVTFAEQRRMIIEESKYLGGDMEHTHLVKGLDYALLEKVRDEITEKEDVKPDENNSSSIQDTLTVRSKLAKTIIKALFEPKKYPQRNEFFLPGRMAYRVDLCEEWAEFDVPSTVIRSRADCVPVAPADVQKTNISESAVANQEIVMDKIIQILAYLRVGRKQAKKQQQHLVPEKISQSNVSKKDMDSKEFSKSKNYHNSSGNKKYSEGSSSANMPIYDDLPEYKPSTERRDKSSRRRHNAEIDYFGSSNTSSSAKDRSISKRDNKESSLLDIPISHRNSKQHEVKNSEEDKKARINRILNKNETSGYDECYPGFAQSYDAMGDSDEETDYMKMDLGNRKGPVGRWDFDTNEEYSTYMSSKEALPKAAFQYGVKMGDGRKTRGGPGETVSQKNSSKSIDQQWQKIQKLMSTSKRSSGENSGQFTAPTTMSKKAKVN